MTKEDGEPTVGCVEVQEVLSDLRDLRTGTAKLAPGRTPLADPAFATAVEAHLAGCVACRKELEAYEQIGELFAAYAVGELPARHFDDYGRQVRLLAEQRHLGGHGAHTTDRRPAFRRGLWLPPVAAAAALLAVLFWPSFFPKSTPTGRRGLPPLAAVPAAGAGEIPNDLPKLSGWLKGLPRLTPPRRPLPLRVRPADVRPAALTWNDFSHKPDSAENEQVLRRLDDAARRYGSLEVADEMLGAMLRVVPEGKKMVEGLPLSRVFRGGAANAAGLLPGDYLVAVNGRRIGVGTLSEAVKFMGALRKGGAGHRVVLTYVRRLSGPGKGKAATGKAYWVLRRAELRPCRSSQNPH